MLTGIYRYRNPLNTSLTFAGQQLTERQGLLLSFRFNQQTVWGECAPLLGFSPDSLADNQAALMAWQQQQLTINQLPAAAQFAIRSAEWLSQHNNVDKPTAPKIPLLHGTPEQVLTQALNMGSDKAKLKLARHPIAQEIELVQQLQYAKPELTLRIDANRGWSNAEAVRFAKAVQLSGIDYVEEPCFTLADSLNVHSETGLPLALDETTQQQDYRYSPLAGVKALVLKPTIIGSIERLTSIIDTARADGISAVLSSSFESNIGLTAIASLAAVLTPDEPPGLDTLDPLHFDLVQPNPWLPNRPIQTIDNMEPLWP